MLRKILSLMFPVLVGAATMSAPASAADNTTENLMVVLRESVGANKADETLVPMGKAKVKLGDGQVVDFDTGWYSYLGDMHVRFVFDGPNSMPNAAPDDLKRLGLTPDAALELAVKNIKRVYGEPRTKPWNDLTEVYGKSPDFDSSYFLDKSFWTELLKKHPEGVVALVAKRGGLAYAPLSNQNAVEGMRKGVEYLHASSEKMRVSSALYLFKDGRWSVFQAPTAKK